MGFAFTAGNSETKNLNVGFNGVRTGNHDKLMLYENSIYSSTSKAAPSADPLANYREFKQRWIPL